jgi:hypothetical protein
MPNRIKRFFSGVHACVHSADALMHTLSTPFWEMVMLRKQENKKNFMQKKI